MQDVYGGDKMAIYAMSDLHLSLSIKNKPMDIYGDLWTNYMDKIKENWNKTVSPNDVVIVGGDISWAMYLNECYDDFNFINNLNGKKIISKGNHDYWWESVTKLNKYITENEFDTMTFLNNSSYMYNGVAICATRGWPDKSYGNFNAENEKIYNRELNRLELSLKSCINNNPEKIIAVLHYPPITKEHTVNQDYMDILNRYNVDVCLYGHLHSNALRYAFEGKADNIYFKLTSADFLEFTPFKVEF